MEGSNIRKEIDASKPKIKIYKPLDQRMVKKFDEQDELGQKVAHDVASKGKVLKQKGEIEEQEALDVSKLMVPKTKLLAWTSCRPVSRT